MKRNSAENGMWKGDQVGYIQLHVWVRSRISKPTLCPSCNKRPPYDLANMTGIYNRELDNWMYLCRRCHMKSDGRMNNLKKTLIDMSARRCSDCGTDKTRLQHNRKTSMWYGNEIAGWLCSSCYEKRRWNEREIKDDLNEDQWESNE